MYFHLFHTNCCGHVTNIFNFSSHHQPKKSPFSQCAGVVVFCAELFKVCWLPGCGLNVLIDVHRSRWWVRRQDLLEGVSCLTAYGSSQPWPTCSTCSDHTYICSYLDHLPEINTSFKFHSLFTQNCFQRKSQGKYNSSWKNLVHSILALFIETHVLMVIHDWLNEGVLYKIINSSWGQ